MNTSSSLCSCEPKAPIQVKGVSCCITSSSLQHLKAVISMISNKNNYSVLTFMCYSGGRDRYTKKSILQNVLEVYLVLGFFFPVTTQSLLSLKRIYNRTEGCFKLLFRYRWFHTDRRNKKIYLNTLSCRNYSENTLIMLSLQTKPNKKTPCQNNSLLPLKAYQIPWYFK